MSLEAWRRVSPEQREAMLAHARKASEAACAADLGGGMTTEMRSPKAYAVSAVETPAGLVVTTCAHYRVSHYAQSGSDWGNHDVSVVETTWDAGAKVVAERVVVHRDLMIRELDEETYDDDAAAADVVAGLVAKGLVRLP